VSAYPAIYVSRSPIKWTKCINTSASDVRTC